MPLLSNTKKGLGLGIGFILGIIGFVSLIPRTGPLFSGFRFSMTNQAKVELDWNLLAELDYVTGNIPPSLKKYDGELVKVPGFMVPLEDNQKKVTQFLLVPTPQACIHVPPPPPNQMLLVDMKDGVEVVYGPLWVHGKLKIKTQRTMYGDVSYGFEGAYVEPYK